MFDETLDFAARFNRAEAFLWWTIALILLLRFWDRRASLEGAELAVAAGVWRVWAER
jgi:hypothetical protein